MVRITGDGRSLVIQDKGDVPMNDRCPLDEQAERIITVLVDCLNQVELLLSPDKECFTTPEWPRGLTRRLDIVQDLANDLQNKLIALRGRIGDL